MDDQRFDQLTKALAGGRSRRRMLAGLAAGEDRKFAAFVAFRDHPAAEFPDGPPVVVLDNVGYHNGRRAEDRWMAHRDGVRPRWLPAYAPEPNPIERVWRPLKDKPSCNRRGADLDALEAATATLLSRIEARFHRLDPSGTAPIHNFVEAA